MRKDINSLSIIVKGLRKEGKKITLESVQKRMRDWYCFRLYITLSVSETKAT